MQKADPLEKIELFVRTSEDGIHITIEALPNVHPILYSNVLKAIDDIKDWVLGCRDELKIIQK